MGLGEFIGSIFGKGKSEAAEPEVETVSENLYLINAAAFEKEVLESELPVIVDVFSKTCAPCKRMEPVFEKMATEFSGKIKFVKIDVGKARETAKKYEILGVPTLMFFKDGELKEKKVGATEEEKLKTSVENVFGITL